MPAVPYLCSRAYAGFTKQCNLGTVSSKNLSQPCPKIDTDRSKKLAAGLVPPAAAEAASS